MSDRETSRLICQGSDSVGWSQLKDRLDLKAELQCGHVSAIAETLFLFSIQISKAEQLKAVAVLTEKIVKEGTTSMAATSVEKLNDFIGSGEG